MKCDICGNEIEDHELMFPDSCVKCNTDIDDDTTSDNGLVFHDLSDEYQDTFDENDAFIWRKDSRYA